MKNSIVIPILLSLMSMGLLTSRWWTRHQPVQFDQAFFSVVARELLQGRRLYSDLWENKPPATLVTYAASIALAGYGPNSLLLLNGVAGILILWGLYAGASFGGRRPAAGLWAAAFWMLLSGNLQLEGNLPSGELFINVCLTIAFALLIKPATLRTSLGIGFLLGLASLYKQVAFLFLPALMVADGIHGEDANRLAWLKRWGTIGATASLLWVGTAAYFVITHRGSDFYAAIFGSIPTYVQGTPQGQQFWGNLLQSLRMPVVTTEQISNVLWPLGALSLVGLIGPVIHKIERSREYALWIGYAVAAHFAIALPARYYSHYYQLWMPPVILLAAWSIDSLLEHHRRFGLLVGVWSLLALAPTAWRPFELTPDDCSRAVWGERFVSDKKFGTDLGRLLLPEQTFYMWGNEPGLYYYSRKRPPSGVLSLSHLYDGPPALKDRVINDLSHSPPDFVIATQWTLTATDSSPVYDWIHKHYALKVNSVDLGPYRILSKTGSK